MVRTVAGGQVQACKTPGYSLSVADATVGWSVVIAARIADWEWLPLPVCRLWLSMASEAGLRSLVFPNKGIAILLPNFTVRRWVPSQRKRGSRRVVFALGSM